MMDSHLSRHLASSHLPLTPPGSGSGYAYSNMHYPPYPARQEHGYASYHQQAYMPPALAPIAPAYSSTTAYHQYQPTTLPSISSYYEPSAATLPPIRVQDHYEEYLHDHRSQTRNTKEEKATGGVSAKLDYDIEVMTDFVVSTTQHMYGLHLSPICLADIDITRSFQQNVSSAPAFRKWIHQVLSATRLPSATILLSLHYLSDRLKIFPNSVPHTGENQIYRLLSVALILGSKFLDDNTFINRSWSDVTAIKVAELNMLELKWLRLIDYSLHVDPSCVQIWSDLWIKFEHDASREQRRLAPLDTSVARQEAYDRRYHQYPTPYSSSTIRSYEPSRYTTGVAYDAWSTERLTPSYLTPTPTYEDYYKRTGNVSRYPTLSDIDDANRRATEEQYNRYPCAYQSYNMATPYSAEYIPWETYGWHNIHRPDCTCSSCVYRAWRPYSYNMGAVMG